MIAIASGLEVNASETPDQHAESVLSACALASPLVDRFVLAKSGLRPTRVVVGSDQATERRSDEGEGERHTPKLQSQLERATRLSAEQGAGHKAQSTKRTDLLASGDARESVAREASGTELRHFEHASAFVPTKGGDGGTPPLHLWLRRQMTAKALANLGRAIKRVNDHGHPEHEHGAALRTVSEAAGVRVNLKRVLVCVNQDDAATMNELRPTRDLYDRAHATTTIMEDRAVGVAPAARKGPRGHVVSNVQGAQPRLYPPSAMTSQGVAHDSAMDDTYERQQWLRENGLGETEAKHDAASQRMEALVKLGAEGFRAMVRGKTRG